MTKGIAYYTDSELAPHIAQTVRVQLQRATSLPISYAALRRDPLWNEPLPVGSRRQVFALDRGYLTMFRQQLAALEALETDVAFMCEHDVLYHPSHFACTPARDDTFYYNQATWRVHAETGQAVFYFCNQVSGLCASRALLVEHYRKVVAHVEAHGFDRALGFEPGGNRRQQTLDPHPVETWQSAGVNVDIKSGHCLTKWRGSPSQFRNPSTCQGWREADRIPGWGVTLGRFEDFLCDVAAGRLGAA